MSDRDKGARSASGEHLDDLRARARHARERYDLYKAKAYGSRPTSAARLRELQRESEQAEARHRAARADHPADPSTGADATSSPVGEGS